MSNPYYQDDPASNLPTGLPGFSLRRSSYASVASGSGSYGRSGATFQQLLNTSNPDGAESNGTSNNHNGIGSGSGIGGSSLRPPYAASGNNNNSNGSDADADAMWNGLATSDSALLRLLGSRNPQLPSFSRAFEPFLRGSSYDGFGPISSNNGFFTPSYLRESVYVQRLEDRYKAKMQVARENQQHQQLHAHQSPVSASVAAVAAAGGVISGANIGGLTSRISNHSLHGDGGFDLLGGLNSMGGYGSLASSGIAGPGSSKIGSASHRGMAYDVAEKVPGSGGLLDDDESIAPLPSRWDKNDKSSSLDVLSDGLDVKYTAPKSSDREQEASSVRADHFMPPQCGIYYFEATILSKKREESTIGIGFSDASATLSRPPGWEPGSWGYHSDDGNVFSDHGPGKHYGPSFGSGDIVGCGVNFRTGTAFFTKNGEDLGVAFRDIKGPNLKLFPTVGMKKTGEHVRVNFGQLPFTFDIDGLMKKERLAIKQQISEASTNELVPSLNETDLVQQLVLQFLQHDGYVDTARAFAEEIQTEKEALNLDPDQEIEGINIADDEDANNRQRIRRAVLEGDIDRALSLTGADYPNVLRDNEDVLFRLKCRKFIEMIRREAELNIVGSGNGAGPSDNTKQTNGHGRQSNQHAHQNMDIDDIDMVEDGTDDHPESQALVNAALSYGRSLQAQYSGDTRPEIRTALDEIFSLFAYTNPLKHDEVAHLLDQRGRATVAEELNSAILQSLGKSSRSALENLYAQTSVLLDDLRQDGGPGSFVTIQAELDQIPQT